MKRHLMRRNHGCTPDCKRYGCTKRLGREPIDWWKVITRTLVALLLTIVILGLVDKLDSKLRAKHATASRSRSANTLVIKTEKQ